MIKFIYYFLPKIDTWTNIYIFIQKFAGLMYKFIHKFSIFSSISRQKAEFLKQIINLQQTMYKFIQDFNKEAMILYRISPIDAYFHI